MFERFIEKAIIAIALAQEEVRRLGQDLIGPEHILLGLIGQGTNIAAMVLKSNGVNLKDARIEVEKFIGRCRCPGVEEEKMRFTPESKRVLELSLEEAAQLGHYYISTEHLLLALVRDGENQAAKVLENLGVDLSLVRSQVLSMLNDAQQDAASSHCFEPVKVGEATVEETIEILYEQREAFEQHYKLKFSDEALEAAAKLSDRYISKSYLPHKAIDLMNEAGSRVRRYLQLPEVKELDMELDRLLKQKNDAVISQDFDLAGELRDRELEIKAQIRAIVASKKTEYEPDVCAIVTKENIAEVVASWTGIPLKKLTESES